MVRSSEGEIKNFKNTILEGEKKMEIFVTILQVLGSWLVAYLVGGIVHEGGHVVAGLVQGWKFELMVVGPVKLYRDEKDDKVKVGIEKNLVYWAGIGGTIPKEKSGDNIQKFAKILLAGPLASVIFGLICGVIMILHFSIFTAMLAAVPITMGIACLIPNAKTGILYTDGGRFLRIIKGGKTLAEEKAVFEATMLATFDPDGRYDEGGIEAMTTSKDLAFQYLGHYYGWLNAKKDQNEEEMKNRIASMESIKKDVPKAIIDMCVMEG